MSAAPPSGGCICCGAAAWIALPDPARRSVASDWRVLPEPLRRRACAACGFATRTPSPATGEALYETDYRLYAHAPGAVFEQARQERYAEWIAGVVPRVPRAVLDVGCGNGSLLRALGKWWPGARLLGCDPSAAGVAAGRTDGVALWQGSSASLDASLADLVVAVNVIEHTPDPFAFLADLRRACAPGGTIVVVCPDGGRPGVELLFADHLSSFAASHLHALATRAGWRVLAAEPAPAALGEFQMIAADDGGGEAPSGEPAHDGARLIEGRAAFLRGWADLDGRLLMRLPDSVVCFGVGEAAGLLRGYAPEAWARVRACTADVVDAPSFGTVPVVPLATLPQETAVLVGVRPADQPRVAARLSERFSSVTTWYDLVTEQR